MTDENKAKYLLADILPCCGECDNFTRIVTYKDNTDSMCKLNDKRVKYMTEACDLFKPLLRVG